MTHARVGLGSKCNSRGDNVRGSPRKCFPLRRGFFAGPLLGLSLGDSSGLFGWFRVGWFSWELFSGARPGFVWVVCGLGGGSGDF